MIRFDEQAKTLRLNVNDLVHSAELFDEELQASGPGRGHLGSEIHADYFKSQDPDIYRKEVFVRWEGEWRGFAVTIEGRADGVAATADGVTVEEIKSTLRHGRLMESMAVAPPHAEQCALYCLLLRLTGTPIDGGVVKYIAVTDRAARVFDIQFDAETATELLHRRLDEVIRTQQAEAHQRSRRETHAKAMCFPFDTVRPGQQLMMDEIEGAARDGRIILCSAPTGIGKTAAALFPMLRQILRHDRKLFFVTAKISQQELAMQTLRRMLPPGCGACAMQITARERSCPMDELRCMVGHCPMAEGFETRMFQSGILDRYLEAGVVSGAFIRETALANNLCPFEVSLALAMRASVVIADYNYVFDPTIGLQRFFAQGARDAPGYSLIVDEAHNLPARAATYYSPELDIAAMQRMAVDAQQADVDVYRDAGALLQEVAGHFGRRMADLVVERGEAAQYVDEPDRQFFLRVQVSLETILYDYFVYLAGGGKRPVAFMPERETGRKRILDPLLTVLLALRDFAQCCGRPPELFATLWYRDERLKMLCLDPAPLLRERIDMFTGAVFMSATLTPLPFHARLLGVDVPTTLTMELPSPFPRENRRFLVVKNVDTTFKRRGRDAAAIAGIISRSIALKSGNYLAFFPSFAFRDAVADHIDPALGRIIRQAPAMKTGAVLDELIGNTSATILLCGVMGGVFSEGVDYPGHMAIGAFIVGPGLPQIGPEQELIRSYHEMQSGAGFEFAYVNPGINRVVQAGGRVIRSETDRGFVMLICRRFTSKMYYAKFPAYWQEELIVAEDPVAELTRFWAEGVPK